MTDFTFLKTLFDKREYAKLLTLASSGLLEDDPAYENVERFCVSGIVNPKYNTYIGGTRYLASPEVPLCIAVLKAYLENHSLNQEIIGKLAVIVSGYNSEALNIIMDAGEMGDHHRQMAFHGALSNAFVDDARRIKASGKAAAAPAPQLADPDAPCPPYVKDAGLNQYIQEPEQNSSDGTSASANGGKARESKKNKWWSWMRF